MNRPAKYHISDPVLPWVYSAKEADAYFDHIEAERKKLIGALPDADKLELLAEWIDAKYPDDLKPEAQDDLRLWANRIRVVLAEAKEKK